MRGSRSLAALALLAALFAAPSAARAQGREQAAVEGLAPQRVYVAAAPGAAQPVRLAAIAEFLKLQIESETRLVVVASEADADVILLLSTVAARSGFDLAATARRRVDGATGPARSSRVADLNVSTAESFMVALAKALDAAYPPVAIKVSEVVTDKLVQNIQTLFIEKGVTLSVTAPAGATLMLPEGEEVAIDESGSWSRELPQNSSFAYRVELPGFVPANRTLFIGSEDIVDTVELRPLDRWRFGLDVRYINMVLVPQAEWYWVPGSVFLGAGIESSFLALVRTFNKEYEPLFDYVDLQAGAGLEMGKPDAALRPTLTLGLASRLEMGPGMFRFADYGAVSVRAGLRIGWAVKAPFTVFAEMNSRLALSLNPNGADYSILMAALPSGLSLFGGMALLELPTLFFGGRYGL